MSPAWEEESRTRACVCGEIANVAFPAAALPVPGDLPCHKDRSLPQQNPTCAHDRSHHQDDPAGYRLHALPAQRADRVRLCAAWHYFTKSMTELPLFQLTEAELVSIFVAQKALEAYKGSTFEQPLRSAFQKLRAARSGGFHSSSMIAAPRSLLPLRAISSDALPLLILCQKSELVRSKQTEPHDDLRYCDL
jgi:hypothetical protein